MKPMKTIAVIFSALLSVVSLSAQDSVAIISLFRESRTVDVSEIASLDMEIRTLRLYDVRLTKEAFEELCKRIKGQERCQGVPG